MFVAPDSDWPAFPVWESAACLGAHSTVTSAFSGIPTEPDRLQRSPLLLLLG